MSIIEAIQTSLENRIILQKRINNNNFFCEISGLLLDKSVLCLERGRLLFEFL